MLVRLLALSVVAGVFMVYLSAPGCSGTSTSAAPGGATAVEASSSAESPPDDNHPLAAAVKWAKEVKAGIERDVRDYTATFVKRERNNGKLGEENLIAAKIRHQPFSVYVGVLAPASSKGDEAIYVEGQNDGNLWGHTTGILGKIAGTVSLKPDSSLAMRNQRYPMTEIGVLNLCKRLIEVGEQDMRHGECEVKFDRAAEYNGRPCTLVEVMHPQRRDYFRFHIARIYVDNELKVPIRFAAYDWPKTEDAEPELLEEYEYRDLKLNVGLTDDDFDVKNPEYKFP